MRVQNSTVRTLGFVGLAAFAAAQAEAQTSLTVGGREIQVHGFFQQGFVFTDTNSFLTMGSSDGGSGEMTDGAVNVSTKLHNKLRIGAQLYARNLGQFGNGRVELDWVFADYKVNDKIGFRGGKVKTQLGVINDTQDMEFLHTWALLPQAVYPLDLRSVTIAHTGGDVYGRFDTKKAGSFAYTAYAGVLPDDKRGGYRYGIEDRPGLRVRGDIKRHGGGADLRWTAPLEGLQLGVSHLESRGEFDLNSAQVPFPLNVDLKAWNISAVYGDYQKENWHFSGELRRSLADLVVTPSAAPTPATVSVGWFMSGAYRIAKPLELGAYYSNFVQNTDFDSSLDSNHVSGPTITAKYDFPRFVSIKAEGHFLDGYGDPLNPRGFYPRTNTGGFSDGTKMFVLRTAFSF
jgi:hypothetical protein